MNPLNVYDNHYRQDKTASKCLMLFLWLILLAQVQGTPLKHIGKVSMFRIVPAGSSLDLSCELNDLSLPVYLWQMLPTGSMYTPRDNVAKYGQVFTLHRSNKNTQGIYFCRARRRNGRLFSKLIGQISVSARPKDPPIPAVIQKYEITLVGRDVNLTCQATGTTISAVYWYKNATKLSNQQQYIRQEPNGSTEVWRNTLMLKRVEKSARGFYECRVFETGLDLAFWSAHVKLSVLEETGCPELDGKFADPHSKTGYLLCKGGTSMKMNCSKGMVWNDKKKTCHIAAKVVKWKADSSLWRMAHTVGDSVVFDCRLTDPAIRVKLMQKVSTGVIERLVDGCKISLVKQIFLLHAANFDDIGIYFCSVLQTSVRPKPIKELAFLKINPGLFSAFPQGTRNLMVSIGSSVDLNCEAYSVPQPLLSLELLSVDGTTVLNPDGQKVTLTGRVFTIHQLDENMKGQVVCRVMSSCSDRRIDLELGFLLPVPPRGMASTPKVLPSYSNSQEGTTVRIKCTLSGGNKQSVEWYKDKRKVAFAAVSDGELELKNISTSDAGNYECRVTDFGVGYLAAWAVVNVTAGNRPGGSSVTMSLFESTDIVCGSREHYIDVTLWQKPRSESDMIQRVPDGEELIRQGSVFTISQGQQSDEGKYFCQFADQRTVPVLDLRILGLSLPNKAVLIPTGESKTIDYLGGANLICVVEASQRPSWIAWLKSETSGRVHNITNHTITKTQTHGQQYQQSQLVLHVRNATDTDTATYICRAQFGDETREKSLQLKVKDFAIPKILGSSESLVVKETQKAELWCAFDGSPQARVIWKKNGRDLGGCSPRWGALNCNAASKRHNISFSNGTAFLRITEAIYYEDHGMYTCRLENIAGVANITLQLTVQVKPHISKNATENLLVIGANESTTLYCGIERSNPTPSKSWWYRPCPRDIAQCRNSSHGWKRLFVTNSSSSELLVVSADVQHAHYKCVAENLLGSDYVLYSILRLDTRIPKIWNFTSTTHVKASQEARLLCKAEGNPLPDVGWRKNGAPVGTCKGDVQEKTKICSVVSEFSKYQLFWKGSGAELVIHKALYPFDAGEFTCLARNAAGIDKKTVMLVIHEKPVIYKLDKTEFHVLSFEAAATLESHALRGYPTPYFTWYHQPIRLCTTECKPNSKKWRRVPRSVVSPPNQVPSRISSLFLPPSKSGFFYRCIAENNLGRDDVVFSVHRVDTQSFLPQIVAPSSGLRVDEGSSLKLQCRASDWDFLYLTWKRRNGRSISSELTISDHNITSTVTIEKVQTDEAGDYLCVGWTANDTKSSMVTVSVTEFSSPVVSLGGNQPIHEAETNKTIIRCATTSGYPRPNITWYRNGLELNLNAIGSEDECRINGFHYLENHRPPHAEYLVLCRPSHVKNTGFYKCSATNKIGANSSEGFLNVLANPKITNIDDRRLPLELGKKLNVSCKATGNPAPTVQWVRIASNGGRVPVGYNNNTMLINSIQEKHYGDYACIAENTFGNDTVVFAVVKPASKEAAQQAPSLESSLIAVIVVGAAMFLLLMIIAAILYHRRKLYGGLYICSSPPLPDLIPSLEPGISLLDQVNKLPYEKRWEFPREHLHLDRIIGSGAFGEVYLAEADGSLISDITSAVNVRHRLSTRRDSRRSSAMSLKGSVRVAVKTLKEGADEVEHKDLLSELKILIHIGSHKNIVNLLGACTKGRLCDLCVIIEYCQYGSMLHFLRARREIYKPTWLPPTEQPDEQYTLTDVVSAAFQVARAMEFLVSRKCIHRDLAARNVLVAANYVVKVADFGLARDVYKDDKYIKVSSGLVPVKWMAIESLTDRVYSEQSDVWSFGVLLWELFTLGGSPYPSLPPTEVYQYLKDGNRMECPVDCPDEMYCMMVDCWMEKPEDRPNFTALVQRLDHTIESNMVAMGREAYLELGSEPLGETDANGYLKPIDAVPSLNHSSLRDGKISSSDRDLRTRAQPERYTELGFKPSGSTEIAETTKL